MRRLRLIAALLVLGTGSGFSQNGFDELRELIDRGYYSSAARVTGPELVEAYPNDPEAHYLLARALYLLGDTDRAGDELAQAFALFDGATEPAEYVHLNGLLRAEGGDLAGALRSLENAFLRTRDYAYAMDWGRIAWQSGDTAAALAAYAAAAETEVGRREPWPHLNRGRILSFAGRDDEAIAAFRTAIEVFTANDPGGTRPSPAYVEAYFRLGEIYETRAARDGDSRSFRLAEEHYRLALTGDPTYAPAIAALDRLSRRTPP